MLAVFSQLAYGKFDRQNVESRYFLHFLMNESSEKIENGAGGDVPHVRHEINNALTAIIGHTQLLGLRGELNEKARERVEKIEACANRIRELAAGLR